MKTLGKVMKIRRETELRDQEVKKVKDVLGNLSKDSGESKVC